MLVVLEDLGFAPKGEGGAFVTDNGGNLRLGGALPTNTDGGGLSATHPGHARAVPAVRGDAAAARRGGRQRRSPGAEIAVAHGSGGWLSTQGDRRARNGGAAMTVMRTTASTGARARSSCAAAERRRTASSGRARGRGELRIQHCTTLRACTSTTRACCARTAAQTTLEWVTASGLGTVYSFTVVRQNGVPPFNERVPFVVACVDLDEAGARMIAAMPTLAPDDARGSGCGCAPTFRPASDEFGFVDFAPAG